MNETSAGAYGIALAGPSASASARLNVSAASRPSKASRRGEALAQTVPQTQHAQGRLAVAAVVGVVLIVAGVNSWLRQRRSGTGRVRRSSRL